MEKFGCPFIWNIVVSPLAETASKHFLCPTKSLFLFLEFFFCILPVKIV